jgi:D-3-phosphoglycerate dehydrogenase/C-terminal binding protein
MGSAAKIVITDFVTEPLDCERRILGDLAEVIALDAKHESELRGRIEDADAVMVYHFLSISEATIARLTRCRVIVRCGVGVDNVDCVAAARRGIAVANIPDYGTEDVADSAIGMMLTLARGICASVTALIIPTVSSVSGQCSVTTWDSRRSASSRSARATPRLFS